MFKIKILTYTYYISNWNSFTTIIFLYQTWFLWALTRHIQVLILGSLSMVVSFGHASLS